MRLRGKHARMPVDQEVNGYPLTPVYKYLGLEIKDSGIVTPAVQARHSRAVREKAASKRVLKYILPTALRAIVSNSFYCSKATYALPLIAPMSTAAREEWDKLLRITMKQTYAISEKANSLKIYKATMEPLPEMKLRERLLRLEGKLARFQTPLHPSATEFLQKTQNLGRGNAKQMLAKKQ